MNELIHTRTGDTLRYAGNDTPSGLYKIRIPAGTSAWRVGIQTYRVDDTATALMSLDAPPVADSAVMVDDTRRTLQRLWAGQTLRAESPGNSGTLMLSQPESGDPWRADRERWLYIDVRFPAGRTLAWQSQVVLGDATKPNTHPAVDPALYARAHHLVERVGLVQSMYRLSGCTNNAEFDHKVIDSGVWPGLIEMVRLAELRAGAPISKLGADE